MCQLVELREKKVKVYDDSFKWREEGGIIFLWQGCSVGFCCVPGAMYITIILRTNSLNAKLAKLQKVIIEEVLKRL